MKTSNTKITRIDWEEKLEVAKNFMKSRKNKKKVLIEIAAQHPLDNGRFPNEEFKQRLLLGKSLYQNEKKKGKCVEIYVPGSRHMHKNIVDEISLSQAGVNFLLKKGLAKKNINGENLNFKYKGKEGVYNSADECFVASSYFRDGGFGILYSVLSPVQIFRKALHYIWFGVLPLFYTAPTQDTYHDYIREVYDLIPYVRDFDPDMQSDSSYWGNKWRKERIPHS